MKILLAALAAAAVTALAPAAAFATPQADWTGFYIGGNLGYGDGEASATDLDDWNDVGDTWDADMDGAIGGVQGGYDWRFGQWVVGVVGEASFSSIEGEGASSLSADTISEVEIQNMVSLRARAGYVFSNNVFVYATAGVASIGIDATVHDRLTTPGGGLTEGSEDNQQDGSVYGAGVEYALNDRWTIGGEFIHVDIDEFNVATVSSTDEDAIYNFAIDPEFDAIRVTASWSF